MQHILENNILRITADNHGAEIVSILDKRTNRECVWNANETWWKRHTPVLFPIVGSLWNGTMRVGDEEFHMGQHGFARDMDFEFVDDDADSLTYILRSSEETLQMFPFDFELCIKHHLEDSSVTTTWEVTNTGFTTMPFQIGGHPAYMIPGVDEEYNTSGSIKLSGSGRYELTEIGEKGCVTNEQIWMQGNEIFLRRDTFEQNALIFETPCPQEVELFDREGRKVLTFTSACPALGLWSPCKHAHAPFVCIEPWWGRTDRVGFEGQFADKEYINLLEAGKQQTGEWTVTFE